MANLRWRTWTSDQPSPRTAEAWRRSFTSATASRSPTPERTANATSPGRIAWCSWPRSAASSPASPARRAGNGRAAGFPTTWPPSGWYLLGVIVRDRWRRHGLGRELTKKRVEWIGERADEAWYFSNARNQTSIDLHAQVGFVEVTRDFSFPDASFEGGEGILFRVDLAKEDPAEIERRIKRRRLIPRGDQDAVTRAARAHPAACAGSTPAERSHRARAAPAAADR